MELGFLVFVFLDIFLNLDDKLELAMLLLAMTELFLECIEVDKFLLVDKVFLKQEVLRSLDDNEISNRFIKHESYFLFDSTIFRPEYDFSIGTPTDHLVKLE